MISVFQQFNILSGISDIIETLKFPATKETQICMSAKAIDVNNSILKYHSMVSVKKVSKSVHIDTIRHLIKKSVGQTSWLEANWSYSFTELSFHLLT